MLRYARNGNTLHHAAVCDNQSACSRDVGHYFGGTTAIVNGRRVYGSRAMKLCKRCMPVSQVAIADGLIAFVAWASSFATVTAETISEAQIREMQSRAAADDDLATWTTCQVARGIGRDVTASTRAAARARCAEIIRARGAA
jgi:hypothetical protein